MSSQKTLKPGNIAEHSGLYERIGQRGGNSGKYIAVIKGDSMPPTPKPKEAYKLIKKTS